MKDHDPLLFVGALLIFIGGALLGWRLGTREATRCGYGTVPIAVTEQDGYPRMVCGCPR